jgi:pyruvate dehydrogenase E1 component beta subunit
MRKTTYIQAINEAMRDEMRRDESVFLIGEDIGHYGGLFRVTRNMMEEFGERRVIDTPISEQGFMGMAVGAAMVGLRPIVELMYMDFFLVCADQIFNQAAKMHYMTGGLVNVPLVIRGQQGGGKRYGSQHSASVESTFAQFPGIKVVAPATPYDAKGLLISAIRDDNPVLFLEHKMLYFTRGDMPDAEEQYTVPIGKADIKREGRDLTIATFSYSLLQTLEAAEELKAEQGIDIEVVDLRSITPLDMESVLTSVAKTGRLLAVHESQSNAGIGAEIVARAYEEAPYLLKAPARRLGMAPAPIPVSKPLEEELLPWKKNIKAAVLEMMR